MTAVPEPVEFLTVGPSCEGSATKAQDMMGWQGDAHDVTPLNKTL